MKSIFVLAALVGAITLLAQPPTPERQPAKDKNLSRLPGMWKFKADSYIAAAAQLQLAGKEKAAATLVALAADDRGEDRAILLGRMLFVAKKDKEFRRPFLGGPVFLDDTTKLAWPLEPIDVVDGVPFVVVTVYRLGGEPETASSYLDYCLKNCDWNTHAYGSKTVAEKRAALEKLIASPRWTQPLTNLAKARLTAQIE